MGGADIIGYNTTSAMLQYALGEQKEKKMERKTGCISDLLFIIAEPPTWKKARSPPAQGEIKDSRLTNISVDRLLTIIMAIETKTMDLGKVLQNGAFPPVSSSLPIQLFPSP